MPDKYPETSQWIASDPVYEKPFPGFSRSLSLLPTY